jgi:diguanylate cyclase (GGDEF)-like protein/PAS domain S-box-containing protein
LAVVRQAFPLAWGDVLNRLSPDKHGRGNKVEQTQPDFQRIAQHSADIYFRLYFRDGLAYVSPGFEVALGYASEDCLHQAQFFGQLIDGSSQDEFESALSLLRSRAQPSISSVVRLRCKDGGLIWAELFGIAVENDVGDVVGIDGVARDVSEHLQVTELLSRHTHEQQVLLNVQRDLWSKLDLKQTCDLIVNESQRFLKADSCILLLTETDGITLRALSAMGDVTTKQLPQIVRIGEGLLGRVVQLGAPQRLEGRSVSGGQLRDEAGKTVLVAPLKLEGQVTGALIAQGNAVALGQADLKFLESISQAAAKAIDNSRSFQEVRRQASTDGLTGAFNRRFFESNLANELSRADRLGYAVGLLFVDVDDLKVINDNHGHLVGDDVLRSLVQLLKRKLRETDWVARYGGDEFAVVLPGCSADQLELLAGRLKKSLATLKVDLPNGDRLPVSFSIGGSVYPESVSVTDNLVAAADNAERAAKLAGGNRIVIHRSHLDRRQRSSGDSA